MKERSIIPRATKDGILKEFNHRCAICGADRPQVHHIDENPSNNDSFNLIPLCPNCHLIDQHNPTQALDPRKLTLFRKYKDPLILRPQFDPLFRRLSFMENVPEDESANKLDEQAKELEEFVQELEMGSFYSKKISKLTRRPNFTDCVSLGDPRSEWEYEQRRTKRAKEYVATVRDSKEKVYELVVELLRYQRW